MSCSSNANPGIGVDVDVRSWRSNDTWLAGWYSSIEMSAPLFEEVEVWSPREISAKENEALLESLVWSAMGTSVREMFWAEEFPDV